MSEIVVDAPRSSADSPSERPGAPTLDTGAVRRVRRVVANGSWARTHHRRLAVTDAAAIALSAGAAVVVEQTGILGSTATWGQVLLLAAGVVAAWLAGLSLMRTRDTRVLGQGPTEYQRVFLASWWLFATVALAAYVTGFDGSRGFVVTVMVLGLGTLLAGRFVWRQWLHGRREAGECTRPVVAVGGREQVARLVHEFNGRPQSGYRVVGACLPGVTGRGEVVAGVPVLGGLDDAAATVAAIDAECVVVVGSDLMTADDVRRLGWTLEPNGVDLMLTAELTDVAGPRITVTPAEGISLVHVDAPRFSGPRYLVKSTIDWVLAALLVTVLSPVLLAIALTVALSSRGPVLYRQTRVGRNGATFPMLKFRSMRRGSDSQLAALIAANEGAGPLFKMRDDPRVTRIGRHLRRYSLDELPQLFNVLRGEMSLVGPRPPLPAEVSAYEDKAHRRLLVKPGLTGLWQVGGRSDLSWDESVRLDVYYVENWTIFLDLMLIAKTARAIVSGSGAY
ncbi:sugar transferase [Cellulomonas sp. PhB143]|uniref:sugar transferase n=1 Tax=Cellulomonas sp. PhB143 TaxID=2485186 RepID=UPI000FA9B511|nr:sugar transferase [Cellulomonas sp. PhB143]ROS78748.1 Undecaprenyl-phosphate galactose phosphotransferase WbaP/exopolysaccharide biosynthesis polyprenyl glycosylphosphotransferase [Cellulomonas sp. PhB143]